MFNKKEIERMAICLDAGYKYETVANLFDVSTDDLAELMDKYNAEALETIREISMKYFRKECEGMTFSAENIIEAKGFTKDDIRRFGQALLAVSRCNCNR